eukprot:TRINITY_DN4494_c0_g1_i2.p1 TRINITY_DN4494_c0_g1~~TRINITY_DN4494_c0_g1_i2.p1  ORF type:complete len:224 (+),score=20.71 TRINITY_DN4494_c0_g1_i2:337-1008(+)
MKSPNVICFQEGTNGLLHLLRSDPWVRDHYKLSSAPTGSLDFSFLIILVCKNIATHKVCSITIPSNLGRSCMYVDVQTKQGKLTIATTHLESMRGNSRTRKAQLRVISSYLEDHNTNSILCGDFNFCSSYLENDQNIPENYLDVWPNLYPNLDGYTEDSYINSMYYNAKKVHKQVRFDRFLVNDTSWLSQEMNILGTEPLKNYPDVFPSDHFGIFAKFTLCNK